MSYIVPMNNSIPSSTTTISLHPKIAHATPNSTLHIPTTTSTTEQSLASINPWIIEIEDQVLIQQQCPEWDTHTAIIDARIKAIEQIKNNNPAITTQDHTISQEMQRYCHTHTIDTKILGQCSGTILQHTIHQEFFTITKKSSKIWHNHKLSKPLHKMTRTLADFTNAGIAYNNNNEAKNALLLADACWIMLDCIQAVGEGLCDGAFHIVDDVIHPVRTAQAIAESATICGYYLGKVAIEIGDLGYLAIVEHPDRIHEKLDAWKHNFSLIYDAIQEKRSSLKTRNVIKETVSLGVQLYALPKVLHGLGTLFKQAHKHAITFAQNIPKLAKTHALTTPEGVIIRVADNAVECMKNTQSIAKEIIVKANNMAEFFALPFGQKFKNKCIKTKKTYKNITSIYEITEDIPGTKLKKEDLFYLDRMHKDHIEIFNGKKYTSTYVYNLDGNLNKVKSIKARNRSIRQYLE